MDKLKEKIKLFKSYTDDKKSLPDTIRFWHREIEAYERIVHLLENDEMTPEIFCKFTHRQKWDMKDYLKSIYVKWICENCKKAPISASFPFTAWEEEHCDYCDHLLTKRTGGGQNDPFGWTIEKSLRQIRDEKIKKIIE